MGISNQVVSADAGTDAIPTVVRFEVAGLIPDADEGKTFLVTSSFQSFTQARHYFQLSEFDVLVTEYTSALERNSRRSGYTHCTIDNRQDDRAMVKSESSTTSSPQY